MLYDTPSSIVQTLDNPHPPTFLTKEFDLSESPKVAYTFSKPHNFLPQISYLDNVNRLVRGPKAQTLMPRVTSGPEAAASGRGSGSAHANPGGRGTGGRGSPEAGAGEDDAMSTAYDPLTGEPMESTSERAAVSAMVSPKCEDKVDYDIMVDLIDHIMTTEDGVSGRGGGGGGSGAGGGRGGRVSSNDQGRTGGRGNGGRQGQRRGGGQSNSNRGAAEAAVGAGDGEPLGAILVFLPGFAEIDQLVRALERHPRIGRGSRVFPLHSSLPPQQQKSIFQRMPPGVRKIVVSTNIAETSVSYERPPDESARLKLERNRTSESSRTSKASQITPPPPAWEGGSIAGNCCCCCCCCCSCFGDRVTGFSPWFVLFSERWVGRRTRIIHTGVVFRGGAIGRTRVKGSAVLASPLTVANSRTSGIRSFGVEGS